MGGFMSLARRSLRFLGNSNRAWGSRGVMMAAIIDDMNYYHLPVGRRRWALKRTHAALLESGKDAPELRGVLERGIKEDGELWQLEKRWRRKPHRVEHGAKARELDRALDSQLTGLESSLRARSRLTRALPESAAEAQRCLDTVFPDGIGALIHSSYVEQAQDTESLLEQLRGDAGFARLIDELGLAPLVSEIAAVYEDYAAVVAGGDKIEFAELEARRRKGHELMGEVIARINGLYPTESEDDQERRAALLAPIRWQNEALRLIYKERRRGGGGEGETGDASDDIAFEDEDAESEAA